MRNVVHGLLVADHPDEHCQVRLSYFTHKTMQRLRTSRSIPSSLTFFFNSAFSRRSRASSSLSPNRRGPSGPPGPCLPTSPAVTVSTL